MRVVIGMPRSKPRTAHMHPFATFAAGVAARHGVAGSAMHGPASMVPPLSRVFRSMRRIVVAGANGSVTFAPHIDVSVASFGRHASGAHLAVRRDVAVAMRPAHRPISATSAEPMLQRSHARTVRSDGVADRSRRTLGAIAAIVADRPLAAPSAGQVPRVLRRRAAAPVEEASPAPRDERSTRMPAQPPRPQQLSPVEVARLTDHIVLTIDRRIAAFRERQGRM